MKSLKILTTNAENSQPLNSFFGISAKTLVDCSMAQEIY